jgi:hypothetical protein
MTLLTDAFWSGTVAGLASAVAAAAAARREGKPAAAAVNAVSHWLWGDTAARQSSLSAKYTLTGFATNHAACIFWATGYEALRRALPRQVWAALASSAAITATAYVVDYHVVPKRLTPGYELRLSRRGLALVYASIALALPLREVLFSGRRRRTAAQV